MTTATTPAPAETPPATSAPKPPALPYHVQQFPYGTGIMRPAKVYPNGINGPLLTPEEQALWAYIEFQEAEGERLAAELTKEQDEHAKTRAALEASKRSSKPKG